MMIVRVEQVKEKRIDERDDPEQLEAIFKGPQARAFHASFAFSVAE